MSQGHSIWEHCRSGWLPLIVRVGAIWALFIVFVDGVAFTVTRDGTQAPAQHTIPHLAQQVDAIERQEIPIPRLARWDSFWFYEIAAAGYSDMLKDSRWPGTNHMVGARLGFLPLYPFLVRWCSEVTGASLFRTALWISRVCLLFSMLLLVAMEPSDHYASVRPIGLIASPVAFILVAAYTESLFLLLVLLTFVAAQRGRYIGSGIAASLAIACRINGLALMPALFAFGCPPKRGQLQRLIPFLVTLFGFLGLLGYHTSVNGDPFAYLTAKRSYWNGSLVWPWATINGSIERLLQAVAICDLGFWYTFLELPLLAAVFVALAMLASERRWVEFAFVATSVTLSLVSGSLWGFPRLTTFLFPMYLLLPRLSTSKPLLWCGGLCLSGAMQCLLLINFVNFHSPAP